MSRYAERYAAAKEREGDRKSGLSDFEATCGFPLDPFQVEACRAVAQGRNVVVSAPTGSGKTVVAEFAAHLCREAGTRLFYTTPIKALSNQKFHELRAAHGEDTVGLLTGDNSINGDGDLIVMTTEVLRNMIYAESSDLADLSVVVMDEVHYLADRNRGPVWEETLIHLPAHVQVIALSATVSNADEFATWIEEIRGDTATVVETHRPVPLHQHVLFDQRLLDLLRSPGKANPELAQLQRNNREPGGWQRNRPGDFRDSGHGCHPGRMRKPSRPETIETLARNGMLPAISFIFSRNGCDAAVEQCLDAGIRLTSGAERLEIREFVESRCRAIPDSDLAVLGYLHWREALESGIAAHHAGLIPVFKETIEALFQRGLIKMVFATETLALGINMPARSVVLERLVKWNGESHVPVTAGEYTQLTGRAGRRGIDEEGHAIVLLTDELDLGNLATMASTPSFPLRSAFTPSYNMVVNLIAKYGLAEARRFNELSFAQFQSDRSQKGLSAAVARNRDAESEFAETVECHLGDFEEYARIVDGLSKAEKSAHAASRASSNAAVNQALEQLRVGDVVITTRGRRAGPVVVIGAAREWPPRCAVLGVDRQVRRIGMADFATPPQVVAHIRVLPSFSSRSANARKLLAQQLANTELEEATIERDMPVASDEGIARLRAMMRTHPCHGCSDRALHLSAWHSMQRLQRESAHISARIGSKRTALSRRFTGLCEVLCELGYLDHAADFRVLEAGNLLAEMHTELDLVSAEAIRRGVFDDVAPATAAAIASVLTFESRGDDETTTAAPSEELRRAMMALHRVWARVTEAESNHQVQQTRTLDYAMVPAIVRWANGAPLVQVLQGETFLAGDFVRWCRQSIDLLRHVAASSHASAAARASARAAIRAIDRDIVHASVPPED